MRRWIFLLLLGCGSHTVPASEQTTVPTNQQAGDWRPAGPRAFPIPADATVHAQTSNDNVTYAIRRPYDEIHAALTQYLPTQGYNLDAEQRMTDILIVDVSKDGTSYRVALTNFDANTTLMQVSVSGTPPNP